MKPIAASIIAAIFLASCGQSAPTIDAGAIEVVVKKIQELTVKACSFLPSDDSVVKIITASSTGETAYNIAKAICAAVTAADTEGDKNTMGGKDQCPMVVGVCIEGKFVAPGEGPTPAPE